MKEAYASDSACIGYRTHKANLATGKEKNDQHPTKSSKKARCANPSLLERNKAEYPSHYDLRYTNILDSEKKFKLTEWRNTISMTIKKQNNQRMVNKHQRRILLAKGLRKSRHRKKPGERGYGQKAKEVFSEVRS
ncbi:1029_t:CDS:2 [Rhizophagus irregularis]|nr:1029_t:CDS:2 [Rhizophagus irregularis]